MQLLDGSHRDYLRDASRANHDSAEAAWLNAGQLSSPDGYRKWLTRMQEVHAILGRPAAALRGTAQDDAEEGLRIEALSADLDCTSPEQPAKAMSLHEAWGVGYALTGSALGASTILKSDILPEAAPCRYLTIMRDFARSGGVAAFFGRLDRQELDRDAALCGAQSVFALLAENPHKVG